MTHHEIAETIEAADEKIILIFAFNSIGKTRVCIEYKNVTKSADGIHAGVYYNALSEDIFVWDNGDENDDGEIRLNVRPSSLSRFHSLFNEESMRKKLKPYRPKYDFEFTLHENVEEGIKFITFFPNDADPKEAKYIKISRGEERVFVWCFFLALFDVEGWADKQSAHFFIDDPVSSLDDHNIFVTAMTLFDLIENHFEKRKIIVTTHHIGLISILSDWLTKGEKAGKFKKQTKLYLLSNKSSELTLETEKNDVFLYHLRVLQVLEQAQKENNIKSFHFALLRQAIENISSFLGVGRPSYVLGQIGIQNPNEVNNIINTLTHKNVYYYESDELGPDNKKIFEDVFNKLKEKYNFVLHAPALAPAPGPAPATIPAPAPTP